MSQGLLGGESFVRVVGAQPSDEIHAAPTGVCYSVTDTNWRSGREVEVHVARLTEGGAAHIKKLSMLCCSMLCCSMLCCSMHGVVYSATGQTYFFLNFCNTGIEGVPTMSWIFAI